MAMTALEQIEARIFPVIVRVPRHLWEAGFEELSDRNRFTNVNLGEPNYNLGFAHVCLESDDDKVAVAEKYPHAAGIRLAA